MKRSEMLNELRNFILDRIGINDSYFSEKDTKELLDMIEDQGMLPPKIENVDCLSNNGYLSLEAAFERGLHQWEKEDETK